MFIQNQRIEANYLKLAQNSFHRYLTTIIRSESNKRQHNRIIGEEFCDYSGCLRIPLFGRISSLTTVRFFLIDTLQAGFIIGFSVSEKWL